jgi:site-specific DNA recombinase
MARALKAIRLSRYRIEDPTVSPTVQEETIDDWIERNGHTAVGKAADLDVSAYKIGPFARPELGNWLTYRKSEFDLVVWARLDRAIRNMADMSDLVRWAKENTKTLLFIHGPGGDTLTLDMRSGPVAELIAMIFAFAAQAEAQADSERVTESRAYMRLIGRYAGGWTPIGYRPTENTPGRGYILEQDPKYAKIVCHMVDMALAGKGPSAIADWLNGEGIPTSKDINRIRAGKKPSGLKWRYPSVLNILRSRAICGTTEIIVKDPDKPKKKIPEIVYGDDGLPVRFGKPIIDDAQWEQLQKKLDLLSKPQYRERKDSPWLTGVIVCNFCGLPLNGKRQTTRGKLYEYLACSGVRERTCHSRQIRQDQLEPKIDETLRLAGWANRPYMETRTIEGRNHAPEMATLRLAIKDIAGNVALAEAADESTDSDRAKLEILKARLKALREMPSEPGRIMFMQTGVSVAQHWDSLSGEGRHAMLLSHGAKIRAEQTDSGLVVEIDPGTLDYRPESPMRH